MSVKSTALIVQIELLPVNLTYEKSWTTLWMHVAEQNSLPKKKKTNLHFSRGIMPKRETSGGIHLRVLALGRHSSKEMSQEWLAVGDSLSDLTGPGIEPQIFSTDSDTLYNRPYRPMNWLACWLFFDWSILLFYMLFSIILTNTFRRPNTRR